MEATVNELESGMVELTYIDREGNKHVYSGSGVDVLDQLAGELEGQSRWSGGVGE